MTNITRLLVAIMAASMLLGFGFKSNVAYAAPPVPEGCVAYVDNATGLLRNAVVAKWVQICGNNTSKILTDAPRRAGSGPQRFEQAEIVVGSNIVLDDGRAAFGCYSLGAPTSGVIMDGGSVNPWFDEMVKGGRPECQWESSTPNAPPATAASAVSGSAPSLSTPGQCTNTGNGWRAKGPAIFEGLWQNAGVAVKLDTDVEFDLPKEGACWSLGTQSALDARWPAHKAEFGGKGVTYDDPSQLPGTSITIATSSTSAAAANPAAPATSTGAPTMATMCNAGGVSTGPSILEFIWAGKPTALRLDPNQPVNVPNPSCYGFPNQGELDARWPGHKAEYMGRNPGGQVFDNLIQFLLWALQQQLNGGTTTTSSTTTASAPMAGVCATTKGSTVTGPVFLEYGEGGVPVLVRLSGGNKWMLPSDGGCTASSSQDEQNRDWPSRRASFTARYPNARVMEDTVIVQGASATTVTAVASTTATSAIAGRCATAKGQTAYGPLILEYGEGDAAIVHRLYTNAPMQLPSDGGCFSFSSQEELDKAWAAHRDAFKARHGAKAQVRGE